MESNLSYWLAIDEQLDSHEFRVIKYSTAFERFYSTEYGTISYRTGLGPLEVVIKPKGRKSISVIYPVEKVPSMQEMLSLLIFWTAKPLFLAVPAPKISQEQAQQERFF